MSEEEWKDIKGYEGIYLVSDKGNIKRKGINKNRKFNISSWRIYMGIYCIKEFYKKEVEKEC